MPETFGQLLLQTITEAGYGVSSAAKAIGVGKSTISQIVHGKRRPPSDEKLAKWAKKLHLSRDKFDKLIAAARPARVRGKADSVEYVEDLEATNRRLRALLLGMAKFHTQHGVELPKQLQEELSLLGGRA